MLKNIFKPIGFSLLALCANANAAIVYLPGTTVDFYYDDAQPGMAAFGALTVVGDSIFTQPSNFLAESIGVAGGNVDVFAAFGTITVVAKSGYQFSGATVVQQGDYIVDGAGASVSSVGDLTVTDSNNAATNAVTAMVNSGLGIDDGLLQAWSSIGQFDLSTPTWDSVNSIELSLSSTLTASTLILGEYAFIQNKLVGGGLVTIETSPVPVPAALWLFVSGLLGLIGFTRKTKSQ
ncbi:hypothetical protein MNBD_GAMMA05-576 [hydrothermal vent metagenome]|uniref:Uncharacterized protein n=1 Tax=hydrothermal vent metagenome TaxID=652676 RepID=A0A3B0WKJ4_9ZZZZ